MENTAVVPQSHVACLGTFGIPLPTETHLQVMVLVDQAGEVVEDCTAFIVRYAEDTFGEGAVNKDAYDLR
jgi:hypothetical protein